MTGMYLTRGHGKGTFTEHSKSGSEYFASLNSSRSSQKACEERVLLMVQNIHRFKDEVMWFRVAGLECESRLLVLNPECLSES